MLASDSALGSVLHAIAGYDAQPTALQLTFYVGALLFIALATWQVRHSQEQTQARLPLGSQARA